MKKQSSPSSTSNSIPPTPNTTTPLVTTPSPPVVPASVETGLGQLINLKGTWHSTTGENSYCVMTLPQNVNAPGGYILKNFPYNEEMTFADIPGNVPNRGGGFNQISNTLFYEQRVYFSNAIPGVPVVPNSVVNTLVHAENGSWLFLDTTKQSEGAYPSNPPVYEQGNVPPQNPNMNLAKQVSVPHGNSILANGSVMPWHTGGSNDPLPTFPGIPTIPQVNTIPLYQGVPYYPEKYGPSMKVNGVETNLNINPNYKLVQFLEANQDSIKDFVVFKVSANAQNITNISFESKHASVVSYETTIWLLNPGTPDAFLMYSQNVGLNLTLIVNGNPATIFFPHVLVNVLNPA
ncbi:MAG: hypothetical protein H6581_02600 [Bacteroidia bacterium]|nr:hypothetical protein [Bacteroidia bacterium]